MRSRGPRLVQSLVPQWPWQLQWQWPPLQSEISKFSPVSAVAGTRFIASSTSRPPPHRQPKRGASKILPVKKTLASRPVGHPSGDDLKEWLRSDILDGQAPQDVAAETEFVTADDIGKRLREMRLSKEEGRAILIINSVSPALAESDFYRIANQGRHVYGWAVGLSKVVQARHPVTREPKGQYYLFFETCAAAEAYAEHLRRYHDEVRRTMLSEDEQKRIFVARGKNCSSDGSLFRSTTRSSVPVPKPTPTSRPETSTYTILPPSAPLHYTLLPAKKVLEYIQAHTTASGAKNKPKLSTTTAKVPHGLAGHITNWSHPTSVARVLFTIGLVKVSRASIESAIDDDGRERNLPWRMLGVRPPAPGRPAVQTLEYSSGKAGYLNDDMWDEQGSVRRERQQGFSAFVLTFVDTAEAARFVRVWHGRDLGVEGAGIVTVSARSMW